MKRPYQEISRPQISPMKQSKSMNLYSVSLLPRSIPFPLSPAPSPSLTQKRDPNRFIQPGDLN